MDTKALIVDGVVVNVIAASEAQDGVYCPSCIQIGDTTPDNGVTFYRNGQLVVPTLAPVSKLTIKSRVTPQEWAALKAAIALDFDAAENWELAQEIDQEHPQTQQVIAYLQSQGHLSTPLWKIFAQ